MMNSEEEKKRFLEAERQNLLKEIREFLRYDANTDLLKITEQLSCIKRTVDSFQDPHSTENAEANAKAYTLLDADSYDDIVYLLDLEAKKVELKESVGDVLERLKVRVREVQAIYEGYSYQ